ncbi:MAG: T9SS type A sorting domain-containing protein [Bacteroidales bacterium]|nr:T9SS type A sorting domain-containing protein [Bacteroidales bacterium]
MKRTLLFAIALMLGVTVMAQLQPAKISKSLQNQAVPASAAVDNQIMPTQPGNSVVNTKATLEDIIGTSRYDMQSNGGMMSRLYLWPDGSLSGTWTKAMSDPNYGDRGTGYNYSDGTAWGTAPAGRIENVKTGWPNISPWNVNGEIVISHKSTPTLVMNTRPVKGTGNWTQSNVPVAPAGVTGLLWPRMITSGSNHQNVHVIVMTTPVANGGTSYQNLDGALLYYRSTDGGANWDKNGIQLPGMTSTEYLGFGGDDYAFVEPHGDTIAFLVAGQWTDTFLMYSYNNGDTWTKQMIFHNAYSLTPATQVTPSFICTTGDIAGAMDKNGVFHVAFGRMRAKSDGTGTPSYYPGTDGIVYWNSTMPAIDSTLLTDIEALINENRCIGYVASNANPNDTIVGFPKYGVGLSSWPQVSIDDYNNIYFVWSSLTVGNPSPDPYNYRHIWGRAWFNGKTEWSEMKDFNEGVFYMFQEYAYPATAKALKNDKVQLIAQTSSQPGSNIKDTSIPIHDVNIEYREIPVSDFFSLGLNTPVATKNTVSQNCPNPVKGVTYFNVTLTKAANVVVEVSNIMGQKIMSFDKGLVNSGLSTYTIDGNQLTSGIYFYTVKINGESYTHKMIVE